MGDLSEERPCPWPLELSRRPSTRRPRIPWRETPVVLSANHLLISHHALTRRFTNIISMVPSVCQVQAPVSTQGNWAQEGGGICLIRWPLSIRVHIQTQSSKPKGCTHQNLFHKFPMAPKNPELPGQVRTLASSSPTSSYTGTSQRRINLKFPRALGPAA